MFIRDVFFTASKTWTSWSHCTKRHLFRSDWNSLFCSSLCQVSNPTYTNAIFDRPAGLHPQVEHPVHLSALHHDLQHRKPEILQWPAQSIFWGWQREDRGPRPSPPEHPGAVRSQLHPAADHNHLARWITDENNSHYSGALRHWTNPLLEGLPQSILWTHSAFSRSSTHNFHISCNALLLCLYACKRLRSEDLDRIHHNTGHSYFGQSETARFMNRSFILTKTTSGINISCQHVKLHLFLSRTCN